MVLIVITTSLIFLTFLCITQALNVAVFGGSGFVGRRVCSTLVKTGCNVVSISRSGAPPSYYTNDEEWAKKVEWLKINDNEDKFELPSSIDAAVSCVGTVDPVDEWVQLFGLGFDNDKLRKENGDVNENFCKIAKEAGAKRFVFVSVSYEVAKALEGPIAGYLDGKRQAEHAAAELFGNENTVVVGPSLIYGGNRFPKLGKFYRSFVESAPAKAYVGGNDFLRSLSAAPLEDWVEKMLFSSPIDVDTVSRVISAGALDMIERDMVGTRKQEFYGTNGKPVFYDDVLYLDGAKEIERIDKLVQVVPSEERTTKVSKKTTPPNKNQPYAEGALIGKKPYLFPIPAIGVFLYIFWAVATEQFVQVQVVS
mmetsp:Transcript_37211/g.42473  ORF Transcript_37211/g.42473 Transcript_37211/m.42473 type:complete len:366 (-) Transcript_37211:127-1224(-)